MTTINRLDVTIPVKVRKYDVDVDGLKTLLKSHKRKSNLTNRQISDMTGKPITWVEHWFRGDNSFSIPDPESWEQLKGILSIHTDQFDLSIRTFEEKAGVYDQRNRIYLTNGIAPTITTGTEILIFEGD